MKPEAMTGNEAAKRTKQKKAVISSIVVTLFLIVIVVGQSSHPSSISPQANTNGLKVGSTSYCISVQAFFDSFKDPLLLAVNGTYIQRVVVGQFAFYEYGDNITMNDVWTLIPPITQIVECPA